VNCTDILFSQVAHMTSVWGPWWSLATF